MFGFDDCLGRGCEVGRLGSWMLDVGGMFAKLLGALVYADSVLFGRYNRLLTRMPERHKLWVLIEFTEQLAFGVIAIFQYCVNTKT